MRRIDSKALYLLSFSILRNLSAEKSRLKRTFDYSNWHWLSDEICHKNIEFKVILNDCEISVEK